MQLIAMCFSDHRGERLPKGGIAVDIDGNLYRQCITDPGWWEYEWRATGEKISLPLRFVNNAKAVSGMVAEYDRLFVSSDDDDNAFAKIMALAAAIKERKRGLKRAFKEILAAR